jgi:uncharacterized CHY-type Zn-finger protein
MYLLRAVCVLVLCRKEINQQDDMEAYQHEHTGQPAYACGVCKQTLTTHYEATHYTAVCSLVLLPHSYI